MSRTTDAVGAYGERVAARTLTDAGLSIIERNWRCATGEIDIIALDGPTLVFCEVKTRRGASFGTPLAAVDPAKVRRLRALAAVWLAGHPQIRGPIRFDVIGICVRATGPATVEHRRGAF